MIDLLIYIKILLIFG